MNELSLILNIADDDKNWKRLEGELGCEFNVLKRIEKKENPAKQLLIYWKDEPDATLIKLRNTLIKMKQHAAVDVIDKYCQ